MSIFCNDQYNIRLWIFLNRESTLNGVSFLTRFIKNFEGAVMNCFYERTMRVFEYRYSQHTNNRLPRGGYLIPLFLSCLFIFVSCDKSQEITNYLALTENANNVSKNKEKIVVKNKVTLSKEGVQMKFKELLLVIYVADPDEVKIKLSEFSKANGFKVEKLSYTERAEYREKIKLISNFSLEGSQQLLHFEFKRKGEDVWIGKVLFGEDESALKSIFELEVKKKSFIYSKEGFSSKNRMWGAAPPSMSNISQTNEGRSWSVDSERLILDSAPFSTEEFDPIIELRPYFDIVRK